MKLTFVTSNRNKYKEAKKIAEEHGIMLEHRNVPYDEIQADSLEDVALAGAETTCKRLNSPCFVEDAGLFIDSLEGFPGPYSSYVFKTVGNRGILKLLKDEGNRRAQFKAVIAYCEPDLKTEVFQGTVTGRIIEETRGGEGFGYDPIFVPEGGEGRTFAEMSTDVKNEYSHRAKVNKKFVKWYIKNKKVDGD